MRYKFTRTQFKERPPCLLSWNIYSLARQEGEKESIDKLPGDWPSGQSSSPSHSSCSSILHKREQPYQGRLRAPWFISKPGCWDACWGCGHSLPSRSRELWPKSALYPQGHQLERGVATGGVLRGPLPVLVVTNVSQQQLERVWTHGLH